MPVHWSYNHVISIRWSCFLCPISDHQAGPRGRDANLLTFFAILCIRKRGQIIFLFHSNTSNKNYILLILETNKFKTTGLVVGRFVVF